MAENMFCPGLSRVSAAYKDGYIRTFKGYPEMNEAVVKMVQGWVDSGELEKAILFFTEKCGFDYEYSGFLVREFMRGYFKKTGRKDEKEN